MNVNNQQMNTTKKHTEVKMNKETLEEAAERYADYSNDYVPMSFGDKFNETTKTDFIAGAKFQAERMYSKEEVNEIIAEAWLSCENNEGETFTEVIKRILNNFKKK